MNYSKHKKALKSKGITQKELAKAMDIDRDTINRKFSKSNKSKFTPSELLFIEAILKIDSASEALEKIILLRAHLKEKGWIDENVNYLINSIIISTEETLNRIN
jgi:transcriptional regulator with XRE-family HTH domain